MFKLGKEVNIIIICQLHINKATILKSEHDEILPLVGNGLYNTLKTVQLTSIPVIYTEDSFKIIPRASLCK